MANNSSGVQVFVQNYFEISDEEIHENLDFTSLECWDSLKYMSFVMEVESKFNVSLNRDELVNITTLSGLISVMHDRGLLGEL